MLPVSLLAWLTCVSTAATGLVMHAISTADRALVQTTTTSWHKAQSSLNPPLSEIVYEDISIDLTKNLNHNSGNIQSRTTREYNTSDSSGSSLWTALLAGALAGLAVDLTLYPLDTIKTRLQATAGFRESGAFKGLYHGIGPIALGSAPSSALFFLAYEFSGRQLIPLRQSPFTQHLLATTIGELASSLVRVPADVIKSRQQVELLQDAVEGASLWTVIAKVNEESRTTGARFSFASFYRGWLASMIREIPFGCIQFPLFSYLKGIAAAAQTDQEPLSMLLTTCCGMIAGAAAGALTTPLDVIRTRIMLAEDNQSGIMALFYGIVKTEGVKGLSRGLIPRTLWISLGGAIFLGGYDAFTRLIGSI